MADYDVVLNIGVGGPTVIGENISGKVLPVSKIRTGANGTDGGDVTTANPFPTADAPTLAKAEQIRVLVALIEALLPGALIGGRLDVNIGAVTAYTQPISNTHIDADLSTIASELTLENAAATLTTLATDAHLTETHATAGAVKIERVSLYDAAGSQIAALPVSLSGTAAVTQSGSWSVSIGAALPAGSNALGSVSVSSLPALVAGSAVIGHVIVDSAAGVVVTSLPTIAFTAPQHVIIDSATLGTVTVSGAVTLASTTITGTVAVTQSGTWTLGAGSAVIGHVIVDSGSVVLGAGVAAIGSLTAGSAVIGHVIMDSGSTTAVTSLPALPAGSNAIGSVTVTSAPTTAVTIATLPALTTGSATIGAVTAPGAAALALDAHLTDGTLRGTVALSAGSASIGSLTAGSAVIGHVVVDSGAVTTSGTVTEASGSAIAASVATTATQTTTTATNTGTIATNLPAKGQALAANSTPVVLPAIQAATLAQDATLTGGTQKAIATDSAGAAVFAAAAAAADASANGTTITQVGARIEALNDAGTPTWDRVRAGITTVGSTFTGMLNALPWGIFHTTPSTRTNGQGGPLETDNLGALLTHLWDGSAIYTGAKTGQLPTALGSQAPSTSLAVCMPRWTTTTFGSLATAGLNIKASAGTLRLWHLINNTGANLIPQVFNSGLPAGGAVPAFINTSTSSGSFSTVQPSGECGLFLSSQITIVGSTTAPTFTATASTAVTGVYAYE